MAYAAKIAILHDDREVVARVAALAAEAELPVVCSASWNELLVELRDRTAIAVIMDIASPDKDGFALLELVAHSPARPLIVLVTRHDKKTAVSIVRRAAAADINLMLWRKPDADYGSIKTALEILRERKPPFSAVELREAIERDYLFVEYQPKVPLREDGPNIRAVEALARIRHPQFGTIAPDSFIAIAEREGLIAPLTDAVFCKAFRAWRSWRDMGLDVRLALNVSPELLKDYSWYEGFLRRRAEFAIPIDRIILEITETSPVATHAMAREILARLAQGGFTLSADDFGTGFSLFSTLFQHEFGEVKIDRSFTSALGQRPEIRTLIQSTVGMAREFGMHVTAEGVETEAVFRELQELGCNDAQGFYISRPLGAGDVPGFFSEWSSTDALSARAWSLPDERPRRELPISPT